MLKLLIPNLQILNPQIQKKILKSIQTLYLQTLSQTITNPLLNHINKRNTKNYLTKGIKILILTKIWKKCRSRKKNYLALNKKNRNINHCQKEEAQIIQVKKIHNYPAIIQKTKNNNRTMMLTQTEESLMTYLPKKIQMKY